MYHYRVRAVNGNGPGRANPDDVSKRDVMAHSIASRAPAAP